MVPIEQLRDTLGHSADGWSDEDLEILRGALMLLSEEALESAEPTEESPAA